MTTVNHGRERLLHKWNRNLFKILGPAQVGDPSVPVPAFDPDPACSRCGAPDSAHIKHRMADGKALWKCPPTE